MIFSRKNRAFAFLVVGLFVFPMAFILVASNEPSQIVLDESSERSSSAWEPPEGTCVWNATADGAASVAGNWNPVGVPTTEDIIFNSTSVSNCTWDLAITVGDFEIQGKPYLPVSSSDFDSNGVLYAGDLYYGVWKSLDDGETFTKIFAIPTESNPNPWTMIGRVWTTYVDSRDYIFVSAGSTNRLYRSIDDGATFSEVLDLERVTNDAMIFTITEDGSGNLYAAEYGFGIPARVFKSVDDGASWAVSLTASSRHLHNVKYNSYNGWLYAITSEPDPYATTTQYEEIYRSKDEGITWQKIVDRSATSRYVAINFIEDEILIGQDYSGSTQYSDIHSFIDDGISEPFTPVEVWGNPEPGNIMLSSVTIGGTIYFSTSSENLDNANTKIVSTTNGDDWTIEWESESGIAWAEKYLNTLSDHPRTGMAYGAHSPESDFILNETTYEAFEDIAYTGIITQAASFGTADFILEAGRFTPSGSYILTVSGDFLYDGGTLTSMVLRLNMTGDDTTLRLRGLPYPRELEFSANVTLDAVGGLEFYWLGAVKLVNREGCTFTILHDATIVFPKTASGTWMNEGIITGGSIRITPYKADATLVLGMIESDLEIACSASDTGNRTCTLGAHTELNGSLLIGSLHETYTFSLNHGSNYTLNVSGTMTLGTNGTLAQGTGAWVFGDYVQSGAGSVFNQGGDVTITGDILFMDGIWSQGPNVINLIGVAWTVEISDPTVTLVFTVSGLDSTAGYRVYEDDEVIATGTGPSFVFTATGGGVFTIDAWYDKQVSSLIILTVNMVGLGMVVTVLAAYIAPIARDIQEKRPVKVEKLTQNLIRTVIFIIVASLMWSVLHSIAIG